MNDNVFVPSKGALSGITDFLRQNSTERFTAQQVGDRCYRDLCAWPQESTAKTRRVWAQLHLEELGRSSNRRAVHPQDVYEWGIQ